MTEAPSAAPEASPSPIAEPQSQTPGVAQTTGTAPNVLGNTTPVQTNWRTTLSPDLQSSKSLEKFTDIQGLAKSYLEMEKHNSIPRVELPQPDWKPEKFEDYHRKMGRPEKAADYQFKPVEGLPEGAQYDKGLDDWFREAMHKSGVDNARANELRDGFVTWQKTQLEKMGQAKQAQSVNQEKALTDLKVKYGQDWDVNVQLANRVLDQFGGQAMKDTLSASGLSNNPSTVAFMIKIGQALRDHSLVTGGPTMSPFGMDKISAKQYINKVESDPESRAALMNINHPKHQEIKTQRREAFQILYANAEV